MGSMHPETPSAKKRRTEESYRKLAFELLAPFAPSKQPKPKAKSPEQLLSCEATIKEPLAKEALPALPLLPAELHSQAAAVSSAEGPRDAATNNFHNQQAESLALQHRGLSLGTLEGAKSVPTAQPADDDMNNAIALRIAHHMAAKEERREASTAKEPTSSSQPGTACTLEEAGADKAPPAQSLQQAPRGLAVLNPPAAHSLPTQPLSAAGNADNPPKNDGEGGNLTGTGKTHEIEARSGGFGGNEAGKGGNAVRDGGSSAGSDRRSGIAAQSLPHSDGPKPERLLNLKSMSAQLAQPSDFRQRAYGPIGKVISHPKRPADAGPGNTAAPRPEEKAATPDAGSLAPALKARGMAVNGGAVKPASAPRPADLRVTAGANQLASAVEAGAGAGAARSLPAPRPEDLGAVLRANQLAAAPKPGEVGAGAESIVLTPAPIPENWGAAPEANQLATAPKPVVGSGAAANLQSKIYEALRKTTALPAAFAAPAGAPSGANQLAAAPKSAEKGASLAAATAEPAPKPGGSEAIPGETPQAATHKTPTAVLAAANPVPAGTVLGANRSAPAPKPAASGAATGAKPQAAASPVQAAAGGNQTAVPVQPAEPQNQAGTRSSSPESQPISTVPEIQQPASPARASDQVSAAPPLGANVPAESALAAPLREGGLREEVGAFPSRPEPQPIAILGFLTDGFSLVGPRGNAERPEQGRASPISEIRGGGSVSPTPEVIVVPKLTAANWISEKILTIDSTQQVAIPQLSAGPHTPAQKPLALPPAPQLQPVSKEASGPLQTVLSGRAGSLAPGQILSNQNASSALPGGTFLASTSPSLAVRVGGGGSADSQGGHRDWGVPPRSSSSLSSGHLGLAAPVSGPNTYQGTSARPATSVQLQNQALQNPHGQYRQVQQQLALNQQSVTRGLEDREFWNQQLQNRALQYLQLQNQQAQNRQAQQQPPQNQQGQNHRLQNHQLAWDQPAGQNMRGSSTDHNPLRAAISSWTVEELGLLKRTLELQLQRAIPRLSLTRLLETYRVAGGLSENGMASWFQNNRSKIEVFACAEQLRAGSSASQPDSGALIPQSQTLAGEQTETIKWLAVFDKYPRLRGSDAAMTVAQALARKCSPDMVPDLGAPIPFLAQIVQPLVGGPSSIIWQFFLKSFMHILEGPPNAELRMSAPGIEAFDPGRQNNL